MRASMRRGMAVICAATGALAGAARADEPVFSWTGYYVGAHAGGAMDYNEFSNPYGANLFGGDVRSPGPFIGGQVGYNYQDGQLVYGLQADATWANLQGSATCLQPVHSLRNNAFIGGAFGSTCLAEPDWFGTFTARGGLALGPDGRMLVYGKGGLAWVHSIVDMAINNNLAPDYGPNNALDKTSFTQLGWTLGGGLEHALTGRWTLALEYDYLHFGDHSLPTPKSGPFASPTTLGIVNSTAPDGRPANLSQDVHAAKLAINYALGERGEPTGSIGSETRPRALAFASGLEAELGGRYVRAWSRFQQDLGSEVAPLPVNNSRLTWENVGTGGLELFGRVDTPSNVMLKGFVGVGRGDEGHINDEDWGLGTPPPVAVFAYRNTLSNVSSSLDYFTLDLGYDVLRAGGYRVAPFVGYNYFRYKMNALGCTRLDLTPPEPCGALPTEVILQEMDEWRSLRLGTVAELMLTPELKVTGDVAYLPIVRYAGVDNHPGRADANGTTRSPAWGQGTGVQVEGVIAYDITDQLSIGVGGRYWSMAVPSGLTNFFSSGKFNAERFSTENAALFAQGSYKFEGPD